ncbi:hypothetical protein KIF53_17045 [Chromobacterium subtsugae]|uniref:ACT domain-containing protein n=2 Tax=Chromobacteriaceae TaxID=1499392 RepID=A0ABS7FH13_9NEIS|nr:hypothetical protein [Chromobacterium subtsugae]KUM04407.1 hypothetical protein Cv017_14665 [Chromobacterium subtsugae]MBW8289342.1 hypothetical protein [Chromobacterium subtsugae]WSE93343.1 hypothetical protein U6115_08900 [Chromobacterium subtsugae]WVH61721.1 hypothetical protein U6151_08920 [Chromobacterium subtsugae]
MRALKLSQLLKFFTRGNTSAQVADFRLNIVCDKAVITTLRKRLFWEMHDLGLRASQVTIGPDSHDNQCKLSVVLNCPLTQRQDLDDMALRLSQLPEIRRVHWGRRLHSAQPHHRSLFGSRPRIAA